MNPEITATRVPRSPNTHVPIYMGFFEHNTNSHADNTKIFFHLEKGLEEALTDTTKKTILLLEASDYTTEQAQCIQNLHASGFTYKESFILHYFSYELGRSAQSHTKARRIVWAYDNPQKNPMKKMWLSRRLTDALEYFDDTQDDTETNWHQILAYIDHLETKFPKQFELVFEKYSESYLNSIRKHETEINTQMARGNLKAAADAFYLFTQAFSLETSFRDASAEEQIVHITHQKNVAVVISLFGTMHQMLAESLFTNGNNVIPYVTEDGEQYTSLVFGVMRQIRRGENPSYFLLMRATILFWYYLNAFESWKNLPFEVSTSTMENHAIENTRILSSILSSREVLTNLERQLHADRQIRTYHFFNSLIMRAENY